MKIETFLILAGLGQILLGIASLAIPRQLNWRAQIATLPPLTGQVFWTYAIYILCTNTSLGVVSVVATDDLLKGSTLARCVSIFATAWWGGRLLIQFLYFDRKSAPQGTRFVLAEIALVGLFVFLTATYASVAYWNFTR